MFMRRMNVFMLTLWTTMVLVSSLCFGADVHYCEGQAQTFAFYEVAKPCKMHEKQKVQTEKKKLPPCCEARKKAQEKALEGKPVFKNAGCCYNDQVGFKTDADVQQTPAFVPSFPIANTTYFAHENLSSKWEDATHKITPFRGPPDGILRQNLLIFFQVFRI